MVNQKSRRSKLRKSRNACICLNRVRGGHCSSALPGSDSPVCKRKLIKWHFTKSSKGEKSLSADFYWKFFVQRLYVIHSCYYNTRLLCSVILFCAAGMLVLTNQNNFSRYSIWEVLLFLATHIVPRAAVETVQCLNFNLDIQSKCTIDKKRRWFFVKIIHILDNNVLQN